MTIWIIGSYGNGNVGDDMLGLVSAMQLTALGGESVVVLAGEQWPFGGAQSHRRSHLLRSLRKGDSIFVCGGGLLNDEFGTLFLRYFASLAAIALVRGVRIRYVGLGIEQLRSVSSKCLAWFAFLPTSGISVRDRNSLEWARRVGRRARLRADLGWLVGALEDPIVRSSEREPIVAVTIAVERAESLAPRLSILEVVLRGLMETRSDLKIVLVPMQRSVHANLDDRAALESLALRLGRNVVLHDSPDYRDVLNLFQHASLVLGYRLHAAVLGVIARTPVVAFSRSPKVAQALEGLAQTVVFDDDALSSDAGLVAAIDASRRLLSADVGPANDAEIASRALLARMALEEALE